MTALTPAAEHENAHAAWHRVAACVEVDLAQDADAFRAALLTRTVRELGSRLVDQEGWSALVNEVESDAESPSWHGASAQASAIGLRDRNSILVLALLSEKTTSDEETSPYFRAIQAASTSVTGAKPAGALTGRAATIHATYGAVLRLLVETQRNATTDLLTGIDALPLHRGDVLPGQVPSTPVDPMLWPLASFATEYATAAEFARAKNARAQSGTPVVYSVLVPTSRIVATPATGSAAALEYEVVVDGARSGDLATVTPVR